MSAPTWCGATGASGAVAIWLQDGFTTLDAQVVRASVPLEWQLVGSATSTAMDTPTWCGATVIVGR